MKAESAITAKKNLTTGDSYPRIRVEVQTWNPASKGWRCFRACDTLEEAKAAWAKYRSETSEMAWLVDFGPEPTVRYVRVEATCTIL